MMDVFCPGTDVYKDVDKNTITNFRKYSWNTSFINVWKVEAKLVNPKGITRNSKRPWKVWNVVLSACADNRTAGLIWKIYQGVRSLITRMRNLSSTVLVFNSRLSTQCRQVASNLGTNSTDKENVDCLNWMIPFCNMFEHCFSIFSFWACGYW